MEACRKKSSAQACTYVPYAETELALSDISSEYAELENFYTEKINQKISLLKNQQLGERALSDIKELEQEFEVLKRELNATDAQDEQIIQAMIENYRTKIDLLERVLTTEPII